MRRNLSKQILCSILAVGVLGTGNFAWASNSGGESVNDFNFSNYNYDAYIGTNGASNNIINYSEADDNFIAGAFIDDTKVVNHNVVNISTGEDSSEIYYMFGGLSNTEETSIVQDNHLTIENSSNIKIVMINGGTAYGGESGEGNGTAGNNFVSITNSILYGAEFISAITGGSVQNGIANGNKITVTNCGIYDTMATVIGGSVNKQGTASNNVVIIDNVMFNNIFAIAGGMATEGIAQNNTVIVGPINREDDCSNLILGGGVENGAAIYNTVTINSGNFDENSMMIAAGYVAGSGEANNNILNINDGTFTCNVYAAYVANGSEEAHNSNNVVKVSGSADIAGANVFGINDGVTGDNNKFVVDAWQGNVKSIRNFDTIEFKKINWNNGGTVLNITDVDNSQFENTGIDLQSLSITGGQTINTGDYMNLVAGNESLNGINVDTDRHSVDAGVASVVTGKYNIVNENKEVQFVVENVELQSQTDIVAENRAVAAAFVNQGTDLINDSLDVLSRDGKYGIKTFAAVHGNRSKYDVNSDLKINGWSSIVGVGNEKNIGNGDFSWGVFYENGSGNYRTYNQFNNEFFRGDGSLVYNGGGIAARFEQDNGVYTEGSLRAGMLKSEMTNALKDGAGNSYGYKSESTYYGAHIGVGKVISLNEATDLDVYGKFFHTYTDGDSFEVAGDKFEFDSITSDRLRIGARVTTNKENKFSTYYGLAYEYEFNGDADMRAQNMSAPEQSLKGSSYMAEIGMNYKPGSNSPWSFDLSMRGYAGQRDGFSGNVQAVYSF